MRAPNGPGVLLAVALALPGVLPAQTGYPAKPIRIIVPFPPGGITDLHARTVGERLTVRLKQPVIIDNRAGAGGRIGMELAARAAADGYNLVIMNGAVNVFLPALVPNLPYRTLEDFVPIAKGVVTCPMIVLHPAVPATSVRELLAFARERPAQLNLGTPGLGNFAHIQGEQFMKLAGVKLLHVPFKGEADVMRDLIGGQVQMTFAAAVGPQVAAGQVKVVATTCPGRAVSFPNVPTVSEAGFPALTGYGWQGIGAPAGTPKPIIELLSSALQAVFAEPAVVQRLGSNGLNVDFLGSTEFREFIARDMVRVKQLITDFNIKVE
jgi:tripartite-type tricarboxylate transporter receptor subunit TctC